jgi:ATP-dependent Clp protease protease subunit|tara:strand:+ start:753 stop:1457 length:705 start_codon:yes stop_codon:yes gene_type:complete
MHNLSKKGKKTKKKSKEEVVEEESSEETTEEIEEEEEEAPAQQMSLMDLLGGGQGADTPEARSIMFVGEVTEERAADLISALLVLSQTKAPDAERAEPIKLYVSTYGGSADEMFGIYDVVNYCKQFCDIETIGLGKVMSAGTLMLASGTKGKRKLGKHCRVMIHAVNGGQVGDIHNLQNELEQTVSLQDSYIQALSHETNMTKRQIQTLINRKVNVYLTAEEAIEKGLADEILE